MKQILISICTYKEKKNLPLLISKIRKLKNNFHILVINDFSGDNIDESLKKFKKIIFLERPKKLGLGSAHKLSIFYAIKNKYKYLISMDADFSHNPKYLNKFVKLAKKNCFVIGSRFAQGGKLSYGIIRKAISFYANKFAKFLLGIPSNELTTFYRLYDVNLLKKLPFDKINAQGYSLGVELVWYMHKMGAKIIEVPINFKDRNRGKSKLPRFQILISFIHVLKIFIIKFFVIKLKTLKNNTYNFKLSCNNCHQSYFSKENNFYRCLVCFNKI